MVIINVNTLKKLINIVNVFRFKNLEKFKDLKNRGVKHYIKVIESD